MEIQKTDWGYIRWMPELQTSWPESMQVGQVVIEPGKIMLPHLHYEDVYKRQTMHHLSLLSPKGT